MSDPKMNVRWALEKTRDEIGQNYGHDGESRATAERSLEFCQEWAELAGRDWGMSEKESKKECKRYVKERWAEVNKEEPRSGIVGLIFVSVIVKLIADWIVNRFIYRCYNPEA